MPNYSVLAPVRAGDPPQVEVEIDAPEPAEAPDSTAMRSGCACSSCSRRVRSGWKNSPPTTRSCRRTSPSSKSDWSIVQDEPAAGGNGRRKRHRNQGNVDPTTRSIIRRIEFHEFTGQYDPVTHEALCADLLCNAPAPDEIGGEDQHADERGAGAARRAAGQQDRQWQRRPADKRIAEQVRRAVQRLVTRSR